MDALSSYRRWVLKTAWEYADTLEDVEDLAQEGQIAMWKALGTWKEDSGVSLHKHLMNKARWRMAEVCQRGTFTGKPSQQGKRHSSGTVSNKDRELLSSFESSDFPVPVVTREQSESRSIAYHRSEILDAIGTLKPEHQRKIIDWFWNGIVDSKNRSWWDSKSHGAKYKLREQLKHLRELVG